MNRQPCIYLVAMLTIACGSAPEEPGWSDVAPILAGNCVRCHAVPAIGGAPDSFRLDVWEDTFDGEGRRIFGAGAMAEFASVRANTGSMPPRELELDGRQKDTLDNWLSLRDQESFAPPPGQPEAGNEEPTLQLLGAIPTLTGDEVDLDYEIADDGDLVIGDLLLRGAEDIIVARGLTNGRHSVSFDPGVIAAGNYRLIAVLKDHPSRATEVDLGGVAVVNENDNIAPVVSFASPTAPGSIFADGGSPATVTVNIDDPDTVSLQLTLEAVRGVERVLIAEVGASNGDNDIAWDTTGLTAAPGWNLVATVSDGPSERRAQVGRITISHATTDLRWADVAQIFTGRCSGCHFGSGSRIPGLSLGLGDYDDVGSQPGVFSTRGQIYQRVVLQGTMPPPSASRVLSAYQTMTADERALIAEWLEGGAPQ